MVTVYQLIKKFNGKLGIFHIHFHFIFSNHEVVIMVSIISIFRHFVCAFNNMSVVNSVAITMGQLRTPKGDK